MTPKHGGLICQRIRKKVIGNLKLPLYLLHLYLYANFEINNCIITPKVDTLQRKICPNLKYFSKHEGKFVDTVKFGDVVVEGAYGIEFSGVQNTTIALSPYKVVEKLGCDFGSERADYLKHFNILLRNIRFEEVNKDVEAFNITLYWYLQMD